MSIENITKYPTAAAVIEQDLYVYDLMTGAYSISYVIQLKNEISNISTVLGLTYVNESQTSIILI